ncbi:MAG: hypothetical protein E6J77_02760 [Deltaproteobacteria bacterium]|nr:MAG: hypothetical protein E6J77_02760 [Deltaproteobacteria bacterium]
MPTEADRPRKVIVASAAACSPSGAERSAAGADAAMRQIAAAAAQSTERGEEPLIRSRPPAGRRKTSDSSASTPRSRADPPRAGAVVRSESSHRRRFAGPCRRAGRCPRCRPGAGVHRRTPPCLPAPRRRVASGDSPDPESSSHPRRGDRRDSSPTSRTRPRSLPRALRRRVRPGSARARGERRSQAIVLYLVGMIVDDATNALESSPLPVSPHHSSFPLDMSCLFAPASEQALGLRASSRRPLPAALDGYLLAGFLFGVAYRALDQLWPGSFGGAKPVGLAQSIYFSFVTLATLGYGDVVPVSEPARGFAVVEGVSGQMYLAVLVARLVSLYSQARDD